MWPVFQRLRTRWLALAIVACAYGAHGEAATRIDPALRFRTRSTAHFRIYYHQGLDRLADRLTVIAEDVWSSVGNAFGMTAPRLTHVILCDQTELANGWATPIPYNTIFVTAAAPPGWDFIGRTDDWLRLVFTHEFTHIVHLDRSEGWARVFRGIFGRTPVAFPNLWLPPWMIEGLATWEESALTTGGRLRAGDFRAIEREAGRARRVEPLDRLNGGLTDWPGASGPYAFGLGFHEFLVERYGASQLVRLTDATARSLPFLGTSAFSRVYGRPLSALWRDYTAALEGRPKTPGQAGAPAPRRLTSHGHMVLGPRFAPPPCDGCALDIIHTVRTPHGFPSLEVIGLDASSSRQIATRYLGSTASPAGSRIVFDQQEISRNVGLYSDLYVVERATGEVQRLTRNARLQDPDVSPDGRYIVCVRESAGARELTVLPFTASGVGSPEVVLSEPGTQFNTPRWSPDGRSIAVARHRLGAQSEVIIVDAESRGVTLVASSTSARVVTPAWRPDGRAIIVAADLAGNAFDLYEFDLENTASPPRRLTETSGGALWPDVSPDGSLIVFVGYTPSGFDLFTVPYQPGARTTFGVPATTESPQSQSATSELPARPYRPWPTLAPRAWTPIFENRDYMRAGAAVTGDDVLGRHAYVAEATWLFDEPRAGFPAGTRRPDWEIGYSYDRWQPTLFASLADRTLSSTRPADLSTSSALTVRERKVEAGVILPVRRVRSVHRALLSFAATSDHYSNPADWPSTRHAALRLGLSTSTAHVFGYSVSPERGVFAGATAEVEGVLGTGADATTATVDLRAYLPGLSPHQVIALRAAGGTTSGDPGHGRTFLLGGAAAAPDVLDFSQDAFSLLRGFPANSFAGTNIAIVNVDYRAPLGRPQRGLAAWPISLHTVHAAAFADLGEGWTDRFRPRDLKTSVGGELSFDLIAGYSFPFTTTVGVGWGRDGSDGSHQTTAYVRLGRSF
jgi:hypothetical protein